MILGGYILSEKPTGAMQTADKAIISIMDPQLCTFTGPERHKNVAI